MRLIIVSNRLPFTFVRDRTGESSIEPGIGGLVTALAPVLEDRVGRWIGRTGSTEVSLS
jgi:trehalose-6-phosphate synthase